MPSRPKQTNGHQSANDLREKFNALTKESNSLRQQLNALQNQEEFSRPSVERPPTPAPNKPSVLQFPQFQPSQRQPFQSQPKQQALQLPPEQLNGFDPRIPITTANTPTIITLKIPSRVEVSREPEPAIFPQIQQPHSNIDSGFLGFDTTSETSPNLFQVTKQMIDHEM